MKVKELIQRLADKDPEMRVVVQGYESGFDELDTIYLVSIAKNSHKQDKWWDGEFIETQVDDGEEVALLLPRKS
jgi:hypothetical protein